MKQIPITDAIRTQLIAAVGDDDIEVNNLAVYEATALNTKPIRKNHPLYKGAHHSTQFLHEMSNQLALESLPLHIMHNTYTGELPLGRVFHSEVLNGDELRVLFWVDKTNEDVVKLIDNSTVDQVSVSVLPKAATCNMCGFDFLGSEATLDHFYSGTDPKGHVMGENGAHVNLHNLDQWFEMSLVNRGGATGARIANRKSSHFSEARLAASGPAALLATLNLSESDLETPGMDMEKFLEGLTKTTADLALAQASNTSKDGEITVLKAKVTELEAKLSDAAKGEDFKKTAESLVAALTSAVKKALTLTGDATTQIPTEVPALITLAAEKIEGLKLNVAGAQSESADANDGDKAVRMNFAAFKRRS
ncbi:MULTISPECIES: hypothetical protein [unclassified Beijerinckia]|uniref:hypothetical protein n=1 Tax=unclassified Beijerinckia TaxID=2638183 RepID=UPI000894AB4D|nr:MULTISPECIES: hypothetical protein [unclassified Beijerinckia]MDH7796423.1 hypothetical protein [Beijerinckia sp. GAS462]SEC44455.1 hypothetical protein SAMN05443249_2705 [Beijerinckia sp. 28-YEA-48]